MKIKIREDMNMTLEELEETVSDLGKRLSNTEKRCKKLEDLYRAGIQDEPQKPIELDLTLPEADIDGLHFNEQIVHAVFEKKNDGWYHSRDILFLSARNTRDDNSRDILTEYLNDGGGYREIRAQIADKFGVTPAGIEISLPKENEGVKRYNGVDWWYWLTEKYPDYTAYFCGVGSYGATLYNASAVGGCAPAFRVVGQEG
jgi:hypothetical protein